MAPIPLTPVYGLPFEAPGDQPLISLTGGQSGTEPILAEEVETELARIDSDVAGLSTEVGTKVTRLDEADVTGLDITTAVLTVPSGFRNLSLAWNGIHDGGALTVSLICRFNGDSAANYATQGVNTEGDAWVFSNSTTGAVWVRVGYVGGALRSGGVVHVQDIIDGNPVTVHGTCAFQVTGGRALGFAGGTWSGTTPVTSVAVAPLNLSWTSGRLSLYGWT